MPTPTHTLGPAPRILIVRLSSLRDVLHGLPVLCALRRHWPDARITWLVEEPFAAVLERHAALDRAITVQRGWLKSPRSALRLRRELAGEAFDVAIDLQGLTKSAVASWLSGARLRIGASGRDGRELSTWLNNYLVPVRAWHAIDHYLGLLRPLGVCDPQVEFGLPSWPVAARSIARFLRDRGLFPGEFAILHPAADAASAQWPADGYAALARLLGERFGIRSVVTWLDMPQRDLARTIVEEADGWGLFAPAVKTQELAELARRAAVVVGSDASPVHLAVAAGALCVSLHGPTLASRTGAYGPANIRLQAFHDPRAGARRHHARSDNRALQAISTDTVYAACARLLATSRAKYMAQAAA